MLDGARTSQDKLKWAATTVKTANLLKLTLEQFSTEAGFVRHSGAWYLRQIDTIAVIELQKSNYGPKYFVNFALWFVPLGDVNFPKEHECHVRTRLDNLVAPDQEQRLSELLDLDVAVDDADRREEFGAILRTDLWPVVAELASVDRLVTSPTGKRLQNVSLVRGSAQKLLSDRRSDDGMPVLIRRIVDNLDAFRIRTISTSDLATNLSATLDALESDVPQSLRDRITLGAADLEGEAFTLDRVDRADEIVSGLYAAVQSHYPGT